MAETRHGINSTTVLLDFEADASDGGTRNKPNERNRSEEQTRRRNEDFPEETHLTLRVRDSASDGESCLWLDEWDQPVPRTAKEEHI